MQPDDAALLVDMMVASKKVSRYATQFTLGEFHGNDLAQDAVIRQIQTIGEAASRVSASFRTAHPEIPWSDIISMRHRLVHDYRNVNVEIVWQAATREVPALIAFLDPLVPPEHE